MLKNTFYLLLVLFFSASTLASIDDYVKRGDESYDKKDFKNAMKWYAKAANAGDVYSAYAVGYMLKEGEGTEINIPAGEKWLLKSANKDMPVAQYELGTLYEKPGTEYTHKTRAFYWYERSAKNGWADAQHRVGDFYFHGLIEDKNYEKAYRYYLLAAEQGVAQSQYQLGNMFLKGLYVNADYAKSAQWYTKSSKGGSALATFALGNLYYNGRGVEKNANKAKELYVASGLLKKKNKADDLSENTHSTTCPSNSKRAPDSRCVCNEGFISNVNEDACVAKPLYTTDEVLNYASKFYACEQNDYIPKEAFESVKAKVRQYFQDHIAVTEHQALSVKVRILQKRATAIMGYGCEDAYTKLVKLP